VKDEKIFVTVSGNDMRLLLEMASAARMSTEKLASLFFAKWITVEARQLMGED